MFLKEDSQKSLSMITLILIVSIGMVSLFLTSCKSEKKPEKEKSIEMVDSGKLAGRWLRPDGGYVLEIRTVHDDGRLIAGYYNPRPINVSEALWRLKDNRLQVYVEMNDINYPGSNYTLDYFPDRDMLIGAYFQAVQQQSYYVEFIRQPK